VLESVIGGLDVLVGVTGGLRVSLVSPVVVGHAVDVFDCVLVFVTVLVARMLPVIIGLALCVFDAFVERLPDGQAEFVLEDTILLLTLELELDVFELVTVSEAVAVFI
jgi:hypothetical protein